MNDVIKIEDLRNPESVIVKTIIYVYTKETFLPYYLNKANREQDKSKINTLGPYAYVLNLILTGS